MNTSFPLSFLLSFLTSFFASPFIFDFPSFSLFLPFYCSLSFLPFLLFPLRSILYFPFFFPFLLFTLYSSLSYPFPPFVPSPPPPFSSSTFLSRSCQPNHPDTLCSPRMQSPEDYKSLLITSIFLACRTMPNMRPDNSSSRTPEQTDWILF